MGGSGLRGGAPALTSPFGQGLGTPRTPASGVIGKGAPNAAHGDPLMAREPGARGQYGMPMGTGTASAANGEREQERQTWLTADNLWAEDSEVAPRVLGEPE